MTVTSTKSSIQMGEGSINARREIVTSTSMPAKNRRDTCVLYDSRIHPLGFQTSHQNVFCSMEEGGSVILMKMKIPRFLGVIEGR